MKIGISGSHGYLAGQLIPLLKEKGHETVPITWGVDHNEIVIPIEEVDIIIHLGAMTDLYWCERHPAASLKSSVKNTILLSLKCFDKNTKLIFASSSTADESLRDIWSVYDRHKWIAEQIVREVPQHVILRLATVYGYSNAESGAGRGIINRWIQNGLANKDITVYDKVSDKMRDYVHVDDVAEAFVTAIDAPSGSYDVDTNHFRTIDYAAHTISKICGGHVVAVDTPEELHPIDMRSDKTNSARDWLPNWTPQIQFEEGVRLTAQKYHEKMKGNDAR